jgi:peptidyl-tRNA hydrolase, PTH1 family
MPSEAPWLVIGLGNPGAQYAGNRHNIGFMTVDLLASRAGASFKTHKSRADVAETRVAGQRCVLAKPRVYMNESGGPVAGLVKFFKTPLSQLVVIHDDLDLEADAIRLKLGGGDGGHNGLRSLRASLGSGEYNRVRLGIGRPPGRQDPAEFVLRDFPAASRADVGVQVERAADAVELLLSEGLTAAQNAYN